MVSRPASGTDETWPVFSFTRWKSSGTIAATWTPSPAGKPNPTCVVARPGWVDVKGKYDAEPSRSQVTTVPSPGSDT